MPDTKISAAADIISLVGTDMLPVARSGSSTAYHATATEIATWAGSNLPIATTSVLGGVKADGTTITVAGDGTLHGIPASTVPPLMDGTAAAGTNANYSPGDHRHPTDTSRAPLASPTFTGTAASVTPATSDNSTTIATTAYVKAQSYLTGNQSISLTGDATGSGTTSIATTLATVNSNVGTFQGLTLNGKGLVTAAVNQNYAPLASPTFSGTPSLPTGTTGVTQTAGNSSTALATTAFVATSFAPLASPTFSGTPSLPTGTTAVTQTAGSNTTALATTAFVTAATATALNDAGRNFIHNSRFNVQQRGTGAFGAGGFTADRWQQTVTLDTISTTLANLADADRTAIGDESAQYAFSHTFTGNAGATAYNDVEHAIENVRRLSGKTVTVSFWAKANSGTPKLGLNFWLNYGTGGSPSAGAWAFATGTAITISTTWARYSATFSIPSASGKTLGANNDHTTTLCIGYSSGTTNNASYGNIGVQSGTIQLWGVQLEIGSVVTPLEGPTDPVDDLRKCQRFYFTAPFVVPATTSIGATIVFPTTMRATPTIAGGGAGFTSAAASATAVNVSQTTQATQTLTVSAEL